MHRSMFSKAAALHIVQHAIYSATPARNVRRRCTLWHSAPCCSAQPNRCRRTYLQWRASGCALAQRLTAIIEQVPLPLAAAWAVPLPAMVGVGRCEPSPGADVEGVSPVLVQL